MSMAIVCHGCGAPLNVPEDYSRNKMQCPECGVMCPLPPRPPAKKKPMERPPAEEAVRFEDDAPATPSHPGASSPSATTIVKEPAPPSGKGLAYCPRCGELVRVPPGRRGRRKCPACRAAWPDLDKAPKQAPPPTPIPPPPDEFAGSTPDEDPATGNPYRTADEGSRRCPGCSAQLAPEIVLCVRCGFDLRTGRKAIKTYSRIDRSWDSGMPLRVRLTLFLLCQAIALVLVVTAFSTLDEEASLGVAVATIGLSWLVYAAMTGFLLGTFDNIHLKRHKSGRVELTKIWRIAFIPLPTQEIDVHAYFGAINGAVFHGGAVEWIICFFLFISGIFPAVVYWYYVIFKTHYTVSLTNEHGAAEVQVYRGWSEEQMHEVRQALQDALTL
jgi:hypothetical protein